MIDIYLDNNTTVNLGLCIVVCTVVLDGNLEVQIFLSICTVLYLLSLMLSSHNLLLLSHFL